MQLFKFTHVILSVIFFFNSLLLLTAFLFSKNKFNSYTKFFARLDWLLSSLLFFSGIFLISLLPHLFQEAKFYLKIIIAFLIITISHYFYSCYKIAFKNNNYTFSLVNLRIIILFFTIIIFFITNFKLFL